MPDAVGRDLIAGLETLYRIQETIGGSEEVSAEKKALEAFKGDAFMELKYRMMKKLETTSQGVQDFNAMDASTAAPDVKIKKQHELREDFKALTAQWNELSKAYEREAGKKKSKLGQQELINRGEMRDHLKDHIDGLKEEFISAYSGTSNQAEEVQLPTFQSFKTEMAEKAKKAGGAGPDSVKIEQEEISDSQQQRMQQIEMRNMNQDALISTIGEGVDRLDQMAKMMGEEVEVQHGMMLDLEKDLTRAQEHVESVNEKLKETLKAVREADRFCMDVFCVLLLLGMLGVFLKIYRSSEATDDAADDDAADDKA